MEARLYGWFLARIESLFLYDFTPRWFGVDSAMGAAMDLNDSGNMKDHDETNMIGSMQEELRSHLTRAEHLLRLFNVDRVSKGLENAGTINKGSRVVQGEGQR